MTDFARELRLAFRRLRREPAFALVAIFTLALPLAANTAIFSVIEAVLLRPLQFGRPDAIVRVLPRFAGGGDGAEVSLANMNDIATLPAVERIGAYHRSGMFLMDGEPELIYGCDLQASALSLLDVAPIAGRWFTAAEDVENGPRVLLVSERFWRNRLGGDPSAIGRTLHFGAAGNAWRVIGVMPGSFQFPAGERESDYYAPLMPGVGERARTDRDFVYLHAIGRLRDGATLDEANHQIDALSARLTAMYPASNTGLSFQFARLRDAVVHDVKPVLLLLLTAVGVVLLIGCANVANLLMARAAARRKEFAIRAAIGASRGWIVRQLLLESTLMSLIAGTIGLLGASAIVRVLVAIAPENTPRIEHVRLDGGVLLFALALALLTGIVFGLGPALRAARGNLSDPLNLGSRVAQDRAGNRARGAFVVGAIALSLVLLAGAGLLIRSFAALLAVDPGFDAAGVVQMRISPNRTTYDSPERVAGLYRRLLGEISAIPGVQGAGGIDLLPFSGGEQVFNFQIRGHAPQPAGSPPVRFGSVLPGYFTTMRIPLLRGRTIDTHDTAEAKAVLVVSRAFVETYLPNEEPLGTVVTIDGNPMEIAGVVGDVKLLDLSESTQPMVYAAAAQTGSRVMAIVARSSRAAGLGEAMRAALKRIDARQPVIRMDSVDALRADSLATRRFALLLIAALAAIALLLAAVGIYSVMSYVVGQSTAEIGVRMALGARAYDVFRLVVGRALRLVVLGSAIGLLAALAATRFLRSMFYSVGPGDPLTFAAISAAIAIVALVASWVPARRASRVDPVVAIRTP